jgi:hypothetical protein
MKGSTIQDIADQVQVLDGKVMELLGLMKNITSRVEVLEILASSQGHNIPTTTKIKVDTKKTEDDEKCIIA